MLDIWWRQRSVHSVSVLEGSAAVTLIYYAPTPTLGKSPNKKNGENLALSAFDLEWSTPVHSFRSNLPDLENTSKRTINKEKFETNSE